jgi:hypothetical protein
MRWKPRGFNISDLAVVWRTSYVIVFIRQVLGSGEQPIPLMLAKACNPWCPGPVMISIPQCPLILLSSLRPTELIIATTDWERIAADAADERKKR